MSDKLEDVKHMLLLGDYPPQHWVSDIIADYEQLQKDKAELVKAAKYAVHTYAGIDEPKPFPRAMDELEETLLKSQENE